MPRKPSLVTVLEKPDPSMLVPGAILEIPIDWPVPDPKNENEHPPEQMELLRRDYRDHGQQKNIVIMPSDPPMIKAGHGWWTAMKLEGAKSILVKVWDREAWKADVFRITENVSGRGSKFNYQVLQRNVTEFESQGVDLGMLGFRPDQLDVIKRAEFKLPQIGDIPENGRPGSNVMIKVGPEDFEIIQEAIDLIVAREGNSELSAGQALRIMAEEWRQHE